MDNPKPGIAAPTIGAWPSGSPERAFAYGILQGSHCADFPAVYGDGAKQSGVRCTYDDTYIVHPESRLVKRRVGQLHEPTLSYLRQLQDSSRSDPPWKRGSWF